MQIKSTHKHIIDACVSKSSTRVLRRTCTCTSLLCGMCKKLATVITLRVQTSWESLFHMMVFAQAISVHGQIVYLTAHFRSIIRHVALHA